MATQKWTKKTRKEIPVKAHPKESPHIKDDEKQRNDACGNATIFEKKKVQNVGDGVYRGGSVIEFKSWKAKVHTNWNTQIDIQKRKKNSENE